MKTCLFCVALGVGLLQLASADTICSGSAFSVTAGMTSTTSLTCGGVTFSNFAVTNATGGAVGRVDINQITVSASGDVVMNENPNLGAAEHENLWFTVSGPLTSIDLSVGGTAATVTERLCQYPIPTTGALTGLCTNQAGTVSATPIGQVTVHSGDMGQPIVATVAGLSTYYVYKDIQTGLGGALSDMNESFQSAVPEPASMLLIGSGLLAVSLGSKLFRRVRR